VRRLGHRAINLLAVYLAVILVIVIAGFLGAALGIWASVLWALLVLGLAFFGWQRRRQDAR
jgi:hypothetical protein